MISIMTTVTGCSTCWECKLAVESAIPLVSSKFNSIITVIWRPPWCRYTRLGGTCPLHQRQHHYTHPNICPLSCSLLSSIWKRKKARQRKKERENERVNAGKAAATTFLTVAELQRWYHADDEIIIFSFKRSNISFVIKILLKSFASNT